MRKRSGRENNLLRWYDGKVIWRRHLGLPAIPSKRPSVYRCCNVVFHYSPYAEIDQCRLILSLWLTPTFIATTSLTHPLGNVPETRILEGDTLIFLYIESMP